MKKILVSLGIASMLAATPAFAATAKKPVMHPKTVAMCMVHGKKQVCPTRHHVAHRVVKKHTTTSYKPAKPAKPAT